MAAQTAEFNRASERGLQTPEVGTSRNATSGGGSAGTDAEAARWFDAGALRETAPEGGCGSGPVSKTQVTASVGDAALDCRVPQHGASAEGPSSQPARAPGRDPLQLGRCLAPAKGIARAVALSAPFWALLALAVYLLT